MQLVEFYLRLPAYSLSLTCKYLYSWNRTKCFVKCVRMTNDGIILQEVGYPRVYESAMKLEQHAGHYYDFFPRFEWSTPQARAVITVRFADETFVGGTDIAAALPRD